MVIVEKRHLLYAFICLYPIKRIWVYLTCIQIFHILKAFHVHSLLWPPDQTCEIGRVMNFSCFTFPVSKMGWMENGTNSMHHSPRRGRGFSSHHAWAGPPPYSGASLDLGYFCPFLCHIRFYWELGLEHSSSLLPVVSLSNLETVLYLPSLGY